jgi:hypothetical protein
MTTQVEPGTHPSDQWWVLNGQCFLEAMQRARAGENVDLLYLEYYAQSERETSSE